jgi:5-oxoprolinase (ATP-hydrolysing)
VIEIDERMYAEGETLRPLTRGGARDLEERFSRLARRAIVLMHGWRWTAHEAAIANWRGDRLHPDFREPPGGPLIKLIGRGDTSVVDAYLSPVLRRYVDKVVAAIGSETPSSSCDRTGGLTIAGAFQGQGRDPIGAGRRHRRHGADGLRSRLRASDRLRYGRHFDRRLALRRHLREIDREAGGRSPPPRADAGDPHGSGRRADRSATSTAPRFRVGPDSAGASPAPHATGAGVR